MRGGALGRAWLAAAAMLASGPAWAQASEDAIKAAFLPKFARYIELPPANAPTAGQPYYVCIIGRDPFGPLIDRAAASETIDGHSVAVRRFASAEADAVSGCQIAFVAGTNDQATIRMLGALRHQPTLTITDARWSRAHGMIHFVVAGGRVRFQIDQRSAETSGVEISSRLLALAIDVKQRPS